MTQIANLALLLPILQEHILFLDLRGTPQHHSTLSERALRRASATSDWSEQLQAATSILQGHEISLPKMCLPKG
jgi:hypothetical protein